ncbi:MAG: TonB C-terminal domain-containing protein [Myxococcota bacterium]
MYVDHAIDHRPRPPARSLGAIEATFGVLTSVVGAAAIGALVLLPEAFASLGLDVTPPPPPVLEEVIAAEFVQLGRPFDELPNREVPQLPTNDEEPVVADAAQVEDPDPGLAVSETAEPRPTEARERRPPPSKTRSLEDLLTRSEAFAEIAEAREREGEADGIEGGTRNVEGDRYAGRFQAFFRRGWSVPTTLAEGALEGLRATVVVRIGEDLRIASWRLATPSGNGEFDASVRAQLTRLEQGAVPIPEPPLEHLADYVGRDRPIRFLGRNARR